MFESITIDDAKWLARLLAQIPREKIYETFKYSGHPTLVAMYYTEIFTRRVDQLVEALGLLNEEFKGIAGELIKIKKQSKMINKDNFSIPGNEEFFVDGKLYDPDNKLFDPQREFFKRNWGTRLGKGSSGKAEEEFYKLLSKGLVLNGSHLVQKSLLDKFQLSNVMDGGLLCKDRCFFGGGNLELIGLSLCALLLKTQQTQKMSILIGLSTYLGSLLF